MGSSAKDKKYVGDVQKKLKYVEGVNHFSPFLTPLGTTSKVQRHSKKEIGCKGGRGGQRPRSYFLSSLGDVDMFFTDFEFKQISTDTNFY